jgi:hypothetical protein
MASHGLDEGSWEAIEDAWQERLTAAEEAHGDADGVPDLLVRYAQTFARAQAERGDVLPLDRFIRCLAAAKTATDLPHALAKLGVTLAQFLRSNQHWMAKAQEDPELLDRLLG